MLIENLKYFLGNIKFLVFLTSSFAVFIVTPKPDIMHRESSRKLVADGKQIGETNWLNRSFLSSCKIPTSAKRLVEFHLGCKQADWTTDFC